MLRACLHLRKSTDEHQAESLETQEAGGRAWCKARGIEVVHVISASGVSRAEVVKRADLREALELAQRGSYDVLVTRDISRLVGDVFRGGSWIESLLETGVRLFYYFSDREIRLDDPSWKMMTAFESATSETERKQISGRTREHLERKAALGLNVGGKCYGYRNVRIFEGPDNSGRKLRTEYAIDEEQAEVVREIFRLFAAGEGYRHIAKVLNARGVPSPRAGARGTGSWDMSSVYAMLRNQRYVGRIVWGRAGSKYRGGTLVALRRPEEQCTVIDAPALRIVPPDLELAVRERMAANERLYGGRTGIKAARPKYLLGGLARCADCGGPIHAHNQKRGGVIAKSYGCKYNHTRGRAVCTVTTRRPVDAIDDTVISWFEANVLSPAFVRAVLAEVRRQLVAQLDAGAGDAEALGAEVAQLRGEVARLVAALAKVNDQPEAVIELIGAKERQLRAIEAKLAAQRSAPGAISATLDAMEARAADRINDLRTLLRKPGRGRDVLASVLDGPLRLRSVETTQGKRFEIAGRYALGSALLTEDVATSTDGVPSGISAVEMPRIAGDFCILEQAA